jgi:hypothetical protein
MSRIVFKTKNELAFKPVDGISPGEFLSQKNKYASIEGLNSHGYSAVKNLFSTLNKSQLDILVRRAKEHDPGYIVPDFFSYYYLDCDNEVSLIKTQDVLCQNSCIEWVYIERGLGISPGMYSHGKPIACYQGYLYNAPKGIGVSYAWRRKGGRGDSSIKFVDVEQGWLFGHESLNLQKIPNTGGSYEADSDHGAAVMGIIMMRDGGSGGIGITPLVKGSVMSLFRPDGILNTPDAIISSLYYLDAGDILLLETQELDPEDGNRFWPLEASEANFDMIRLAAALGIIVIEPAGNGNKYSNSGNDMDLYRNHLGRQTLNRNDPDFKDSGAIMVAAASSEVPHKRLPYTNYGSRVDSYAWGENITTAGMHPRSSGMAINTYTHQFGGTSGAAAIVAGVAISLQSMMEANHHCRLQPSQMREVLSNLSFGTASSNGIDIDHIGVMPDLEKITRDFVDKFDRQGGIIPMKQNNIEMPSIYDEAV